MRAADVAWFLAPTLLVGSLAAAQVAKPAAAPASPAPFRLEEQTVVFDLLNSRGEAPVLLTAPRGQHFRLVLKNHAPSGSYRVAYDWIIHPDTPSRPSAGALQRRYETAKPPESLLRLLKISPPCDELQRRANEVLQVVEESGVPEKLTAFLAAHGAGACPRLTHLESTVTSNVDLKLVPYYTLYEGDELHFTVERFDASTGLAVKTWRFNVRAEPVRLGWIHKNEEAWIVGETSRDIVEMILYARDRSLPASSTLALSVVPEAGPQPVSRYSVSFALRPGASSRHLLGFESYIWAPASYQPLAAGLIQALGLRPATPSPEGPVSDALKNPLSRVLVQESARISRRLEQAMLDAGAHEQAALVVGALALREASGTFTEIRPALCRISAHLALARALRRGEGSATAEYAETLLLTLVNRQRDALAHLDRLDAAKPGPAWAPILRALRIRNARDWRVLPEAAKAEATLLERLEHYRALRQSLGSSQALEFLESFEPEAIGDWGRVSLQSAPTVEEGHRFAAEVAGLELADAADVWRSLHGAPLAADKLVEALNAPPQRLVAEEGGKATPRVIGWNAWARYFHRNVSFAAAAHVSFLERSLSLEEEARLARDLLARELSALELWPAVTLEPELRFGPEAKRDGCERGVALVQSAPERVPAALWGALQQSCAKARNDQSLPPPSRWFVVQAPAGTALVQRARIMALAPSVKDLHPVYEALHELAPFDPLILEMLAPSSEQAGPQALAALYGPLTDYDLAAMKRLASAHVADPAAYRAIYEKVAAIDPQEYLALGHHLVDIGLDDEAAAAYEEAVAKARGRVGLSQGLRWLVGYYCDHGRTARARELADMLADVYSSGGLQSKAYFLERMGRYPEAEQWYQKIVERYGDDSSGALEDFYIRYEHRVADGRFATQAKAAMAKVFPSGLERVSIAELTSPPAAGEGVTVSGRYQRTTRFGLIKGDIVVALNGIRIRNDRQYQLIWTFDDDPEATAIAWRRGRYVEVRGRLKDMNYSPVPQPR